MKKEIIVPDSPSKEYDPGYLWRKERLRLEGIPGAKKKKKKKIILYEGQYCGRILFTLIVGMLAGYLIGL